MSAKRIHKLRKIAEKKWEKLQNSTRPIVYVGAGSCGRAAGATEVIEAIQEYKAVYFGAIGGAAALMARSVKTAQVVAYEDLGPEAIRRLEVENFPAVVVNDCHGGDLYKEGMERYRE